jgi:hypothetical protein
LIIVPLAALDDLQALSLELQLPELAHRPLAQDPHYVELTPTNEQRTQITALLTEAFQRGHLHILTGTQALLGEGWDAPAINTLVLASYIGSFVTSNQMRGAGASYVSEKCSENGQHLAPRLPGTGRSNRRR